VLEERRRRWIELSLVGVLGLANVGSELWGAGKALVVAAGVLAWTGYLAWRLREQPGFLRELFALPHGWPRALALLVAVTAAGCIAAGLAARARGGWRWSSDTTLMLGVYTPWGVAQQFLLNGVLARHCRHLAPRWGAPLAALLFALAHAPDWLVVAAVFPAALFWVWLFPRLPHLGLLGLAHGVLGTVFFSAGLGRSFADSLRLTLQ
jgi:hypothetical protein